MLRLSSPLELMNQHHRSPDVSSPSCPSISPVIYRPASNPPPPQHPITLCLQTKQPPSPSTLPQPPPAIFLLSCAAAVHKYINLVSVYACVSVCVCCGGCWHIDDGPATPQADPLSCVTRSQTLSVYTSDPSRHTTRPLPTLPQPCPREPVALVGETRGQRLRVNLEVVVPDWLSDLTDCCRPDGRYDRRSEVKGGHKKKKSADLV